MIAKIGKGSNLYGALSYNQQKVDKENGAILLLHKIPETWDGRYSIGYLHDCFQPYLYANIKTEKTVRHISLNPDPKDKVSDERFTEMAKEYMEKMGYGNQPYVVFKHTDIDRTHIHIVSTCVDLSGKKIADSYDHPRSMAICRELEKKYNLHPAMEQQKQNDSIFQPVAYQSGDIKSQMAGVIRHLPRYYQYQSLGAYNALLSLFNVTAEEVKGERNGKAVNGLVYFALDERGNKISNPFKASFFGKEAGMAQLQKHFEQSKEKMKISPARSVLKNTVELALHTNFDEKEFRKQLVEQGINIVIRRNSTGRIYGMTFIDHESRTVWNGSQLGKNLSANVFNDWWNNGNKPKIAFVDERLIQSGNPKINDLQLSNDLFHFSNNESISPVKTSSAILESLGSLLPESHGEDYEEEQFAYRMKKKKKGRRL